MPTEEPSLAEKVDPQVDAQVDAEGRADVWVRLAERAEAAGWDGVFADKGAHKIFIQVQAIDDPGIAAVEDSVFLIR